MIFSRLRAWVLLLALILGAALVTTYSYGKWFSHERYWNGTIARVEVGQAHLIRDLVQAMPAAIFDGSIDRWDRMFAALRNRLIVEVVHEQRLVYSNENQRFGRGRPLETVQVGEEWQLQITAYQSPAWSRNFRRWITNPARWLEPSFDHITWPFFWFAAAYFLAIVATGFAVKSRYLERDVMLVMRRIEERIPR